MRFGAILKCHIKTIIRMEDTGETDIFNLLNSKVCVGGYTDCLRSHVYDDHHRAGDKAFEKVVDLLVRCA